MSPSVLLVAGLGALREMRRVLAPSGRLDDHARTAVAQDVVASWQPFTQQGRLILELGFSVASGEK